MKKILFLLLICLIKLNIYCYEYVVFKNEKGVPFYEQIYLTAYHSETGKYELSYKFVRLDGSSGIYYGDGQFYGTLNNIKNGVKDWISNDEFYNYYSNDLIFLNDLFTQRSQPFLNYLYNENSFSSTNHIIYENYQILYNENDLAVESIVGGVWKGFYDSPENSGYLYDKDNNVLYHNGEVASLFQRFWYALTGNISKTLKLYYISMLSLNVFLLILAVYLVKVLLGLIIKWITTVINNTKVNVNFGVGKRW